MLRPFLALLLAVPVFAAPKQQKEPVGYYFATRVGDQRVLETESSDGKSLVTQVIDKVEKKDGAVHVVVIVDPDKAGQAIPVQYEVSDKGLALLQDPGKKDPKRIFILKLPAKVGDEWANEDRPGDKYSIKSVDEEVEVPAGKFKCIRVERVLLQPNGEEYKESICYAKNVGVVKGEVLISGKVIRSGQLKSFTPGK